MNALTHLVQVLSRPQYRWMRWAHPTGIACSPQHPGNTLNQRTE